MGVNVILLCRLWESRVKPGRLPRENTVLIAHTWQQKARGGWQRAPSRQPRCPRAWKILDARSSTARTMAAPQWSSG
ncbi:hypothetical protein chiPu_0000790 [Chiloscyllium punctatum]|uniref:Uncharacterized protein n=1 Tax=Chiloscyllium punctatum TaxID=137246 RepID=A0A401RW90_CHIPU|nr:hypothetical protein [Chiloscyllium punctatum]